MNDRYFEGYAGVPEPSKRARVTNRYTVDDNETDDPTGADAGDVVQAESEANYKKKDRVWQKKDLQWYYVQKGAMKGQALDVAGKVAHKSGLALEVAMDDFYDNITSTNASHLLEDWITKKKSPKESVNEHSVKWGKQIKEIEANMDWEQIKCCLYLSSLGHPYQGFFDISTNGGDKLDINKLMRGAADYRRGKVDDEAITEMVMQAKEQQQEQPKQTRDMHARPCANCKDKYHCMAECFKPGGGLGHLSQDDRRAWIDARRTRREHTRGDRGACPHKNRTWTRETEEQANMAKELNEAKTQLKSQEMAMAVAKLRVEQSGVMIELGY